MLRITFEQVDRLFFRTNSPFDRFSKMWEMVDSQFPPSAFTLSGAFRAAVARDHFGWNGSSWTDEMKRNLGSGIHDIEPLEFMGPYIEKQSRLYVQAPLFLVSKPDKTIDAIKPDLDHQMSMLGADSPVYALKPDDNEKYDVLKQRYISLEALKGLLNLQDAKADDLDLKSENCFHAEEYQPGVFLKLRKKSAADERGFFTRQFIRLNDDVRLVMMLTGLSLELPSQMVTPLGGESRVGVIQTDNQEFSLPKIRNLNKDSNGCRFFVYFVSHYTPSAANETEKTNVVNALKKDLQLPDIDFIGSSVGKYIRIGGWDMFSSKPLQLDAFIPAGSVFFFRAAESMENEILAGTGNRIGQYRRFGFGQYIIGTW